MNNNFICKFCNSEFSRKNNLMYHQKTAKFCLIIQGKENNEFECKFCHRQLSTKNALNIHRQTCKEKIENNITTIKDENKKLIEENIESQKQLIIKSEEIKNLKKQIIEKNQKIEKLEDTIIGFAESKHELNTNLESYETQIQELTIKYGGKKQKRQQIKEPNVIYILSTDLLEKERRYIFGKSKNLTTRLSTYNKSDEHKIIYYQPCRTESNMDVIEKLVLNKLEKYREIENRDRFILPEDKEIDFFIDVIKKSINFVLEN
jgi:chromosome segregation ATPase